MHQKAIKERGREKVVQCMHYFQSSFNQDIENLLKMLVDVEGWRVNV